MLSMGVKPYDAAKEMMFFPPTTMTIAAPGELGITSAAKVVVVIRIQTNEN
jgi:hypothetical protein